MGINSKNNMMDIDIFEIDNSNFENSKLKNKYIRESTEEWIGYADASVTAKEEIIHILEENDFLFDYDAIVFASGCVDGEVTLEELLECPQSVIFGFCIRRGIVVKTGSFNELLDGNTNYEFLLRVAEAGNMYVVSCKADKEPVLDARTLAYIVRKYMVLLKTRGVLDEVFMQFVKLAENYNVLDTFNLCLKDFLADSVEYTKLVENTAPFLILVGDNTCAGVLAGFSRDLADELVALGQAVISTDERYGDYDHVSTQTLLEQNYKAIIGMQAKALESDAFKEMKGKKVQFWFDDPTFFVPFFKNNSKETYVLCQDANYAEYIRKYYDIPNAMHFPPGGRIVDNLPTEKIYDLVFVGSYEPIIESPFEDAGKREFYEYMLKCQDATFEQGMLEFYKEKGIVFDAEEMVQQLFEWKDVCLAVKNRERHNVIEKILSAGIQLHVFSENWELYQGIGKEHLIIHPTVYEEEPFKVWAQAKIGLNIMRGHKAGMTERIANIMLCGTCCLSDETIYLTEHFTDGEDIVLYKRTDLDELPKKIKYLLEHDDKREEIARNGQEKAKKEHNWRKRAEDLLGLLNA